MLLSNISISLSKKMSTRKKILQDANIVIKSWNVPCGTIRKNITI